MKKVVLCVSMSVLLVSVVSVSCAAAEPVSTGKSSEPTEALVLMERLEELKSVDRSNMTAPEKKQLRKEIRFVSNQLDEPGSDGGLFISLAPTLLVIILIII